MKQMMMGLVVVGLLASPLAIAETKDAEKTVKHTTTTTTTEKEEKSTGVERPDSWVMAKVKSTFAVSDVVDATDISVSVTNGNVVLSGTAGSTNEVNEAKRLAQGIEGVKSVDASKVVVPRQK